MSALADQRRQARDLVRLREVRMRGAANALAEARAATALAERERAAADQAARTATAHHAQAMVELIDDPGEAERRLAVLDQRRFHQSIAGQTLAETQEAEQARIDEEAVRRRAMIVARARHDVLAERLGAIGRRAERLDEERAAIDAEDVRRFR